MKFIKGDTSLRIQLSNTDKGKFTETPYQFISCIYNNGTQIIIESNIDPNPQNLTYSYASVTEPVTANINILTEILSCWVLEKSRLPKNENGDRYIQHLPDVTSTGCWGIISHDACPNVLQAVGNTLYFDGQPLGAGGGGALVSADNGLEVNPSGNVRMGGTLIQDTYTDAQGFEYFMNNPRIWRVQMGVADPRGVILLDSTRTLISNSTAVEICTPDIIGGNISAGMALVCQDASSGDVDFKVMLNANFIQATNTYSPALQSPGFIVMNGTPVVNLPNISGVNTPSQRFTIFNNTTGNCVINAFAGGGVFGKFNGAYTGTPSVTLTALGDSVTIVGLAGIGGNQWFIESHNK